jgi:hypothetical protein
MLNVNKETKFVLLFFAVICIILLVMMINDFRIVDCCYFILVLIFATRFLILGKE